MIPAHADAFSAQPSVFFSRMCVCVHLGSIHPSIRDGSVRRAGDRFRPVLTRWRSVPTGSDVLETGSDRF